MKSKSTKKQIYKVANCNELQLEIVKFMTYFWAYSKPSSQNGSISLEKWPFGLVFDLKSGNFHWISPASAFVSHVFPQNFCLLRINELLTDFSKRDLFKRLNFKTNIRSKFTCECLSSAKRFLPLKSIRICFKKHNSFSISSRFLCFLSRWFLRVTQISRKIVWFFGWIC